MLWGGGRACDVQYGSLQDRLYAISQRFEVVISQRFEVVVSSVRRLHDGSLDELQVWSDHWQPGGDAFDVVVEAGTIEPDA